MGVIHDLYYFFLYAKKSYYCMMSLRDERYKLISLLYNAGEIKSLGDIFKFIPKTVIAHDLGKKVDRFNRLLDRIENFTLRELILIARFCEMDEDKIVQLALNEYKQKKLANRLNR